MALGDSLTQGYGLAPEDGFVPRLEAELEASGRDVDVVNAGVSGDTTAGGLSRVAWSLTDETDAVIVALGGNDALRGIAPETVRANLAGILEEIAARDLPVLLVGIAAPGNYGADYRDEFGAIWPDLAADYDTALYPNFVEALTEAEGSVLDWLQPDGLHPTAEGVKLIVEDMAPAVSALADEAAGG